MILSPQYLSSYSSFLSVLLDTSFAFSKIYHISARVIILFLGLKLFFLVVSFWMKSELLSLTYEVLLEGAWLVSLDSSFSTSTPTSSAIKCLEVALRQHTLTHLCALVNIFLLPGMFPPLRHFYNLTNFCLSFKTWLLSQFSPHPLPLSQHLMFLYVFPQYPMATSISVLQNLWCYNCLFTCLITRLKWAAWELGKRLPYLCFQWLGHDRHLIRVLLSEWMCLLALMFCFYLCIVL